jgi:hypothetical protein
VASIATTMQADRLVNAIVAIALAPCSHYPTSAGHRRECLGSHVAFQSR